MNPADKENPLAAAGPGASQPDINPPSPRSIRDDYAMAALNALIQNQSTRFNLGYGPEDVAKNLEKTVRLSFAYADVAMKMREPTQPPAYTHKSET